MPQKYFADQFDDEEMLYMFRKHPIVMRKALIFSSLFLLAGVLPSLIWPTFQVFFGGLAIGLLLFVCTLFYSWIGWYFTVYIVTDQRFIQISQKGLWNRSVVDIGINKIQTVSYQVKGLEQSLLGFGTIVIQTYVGELVIHHVHHPRAIQKRLTHILRELGVTTAVPASNE
ncbi:MAG TPA: PH domain-containing protein [Candidatus Saccharibacteria bacterium]|nr:PH domain-containing protein [Candidatus Saccharibacteria bacterium]MCB9817401.1 PH domain-containing protein [Candidatus Nomurabacteria bacterium]HPR10359.1 PH domain-containing protein [Candidatus Saccharibacteria bacterium]